MASDVSKLLVAFPTRFRVSVTFEQFSRSSTLVGGGVNILPHLISTDLSSTFSKFLLKFSGEVRMRSHLIALSSSMDFLSQLETCSHHQEKD